MDENKYSTGLGSALRAVREVHSSDREKALQPSAMILRAQMDGVSGDIFAFLNYFADVIQSYKLKPWGRKGKKALVDAIESDDCNYESWIQCEKCRKEFKPVVNNHLINAFLDYYRDRIDWGVLIRCNDCAA